MPVGEPGPQHRAEIVLFGHVVHEQFFPELFEPVEYFR
jgi:hypothetical protein